MPRFWANVRNPGIRCKGVNAIMYGKIKNRRDHPEIRGKIAEVRPKRAGNFKEKEGDAVAYQRLPRTGGSEKSGKG